MRSRWPFLPFAIALAAVASVLAAGVPAPAPRPADELALGTASAAPGATVRLPVRLFDRPGTPLGSDQPFGAGIQAFSLKVRAVPSDAVLAMTVRRAGAAATRTPLFESSPSSAGSAALLASFEEAGAPLAAFPDRRGILLAEIEVRLAPSAAPGTRIELRLDPAVSVLANQAGTLEESCGNGGLRLVDGVIRVLGPWPATDSD